MRPMFTTCHLIVRMFQADDAHCLYENHLEKEMKLWIPNESYADLAEAQSAIKFYINCVEQHHLPYVLAVVLKETGTLIGDVGVNEVEGNPQEVEIGYSICKKHSGRGYATELVGTMTDYIASPFHPILSLRDSHLHSSPRYSSFYHSESQRIRPRMHTNGSANL